MAELCYNRTFGYHDCKVWKIVGGQRLDYQKGDSFSLSLRYERPRTERLAAGAENGAGASDDASGDVEEAQQEAVERVEVRMDVIGRTDYVNSYELICQTVYEGEEYRAEVFVSDGLGAGSVKFLSLKSPYGFE